MTAAYEFNIGNYLGWNYQWVGGSSKRLRQSDHILKVYPRVSFHILIATLMCLLQAYAVKRVVISEIEKFKVLGVTQSTAFKLMSYRRACKYCQRTSPVLEDGSSRNRILVQCQCAFGFEEVIASAISSDRNELPVSANLEGTYFY